MFFCEYNLIEKFQRMVFVDRILEEIETHQVYSGTFEEPAVIQDYISKFENLRPNMVRIASYFKRQLIVLGRLNTEANGMMHHYIQCGETLDESDGRRALRRGIYTKIIESTTSIIKTTATLRTSLKK